MTKEELVALMDSTIERQKARVEQLQATEQRMHAIRTQGKEDAVFLPMPALSQELVRLQRLIATRLEWAA